MKVTWMAYKGKELQHNDIHWIRHFVMVNKGSEKIAMTLKELSLDTSKTSFFAYCCSPSEAFSAHSNIIKRQMSVFQKPAALLFENNTEICCYSFSKQF
jgi:hypothetical protein